MKKFSLLLAILVVLGLVLAACAPAAEPTEAPEVEAPTEAVVEEPTEPVAE